MYKYILFSLHLFFSVFSFLYLSYIYRLFICLFFYHHIIFPLLQVWFLYIIPDSGGVVGVFWGRVSLHRATEPQTQPADPNPPETGSWTSSHDLDQEGSVISCKHTHTFERYSWWCEFVLMSTPIMTDSVWRSGSYTKSSAVISRTAFSGSPKTDKTCRNFL